MKRKSIGITKAGTIESLDIQNTGLRPSWEEFWKVDHVENITVEGGVFEGKMEGKEEKTTTVSTISSFKSEEGGFRHVRFITGSEWHGEWDRLGMSGMGVYKMPHGVVYEGTMNAGVFEGIGTLRYPNGGLLEGFWHDGKLKYCQYEYKDGLKRDTPVDWPYCRYPDRRFYSELQHGLKPAMHEQMTNSSLARDIPTKQFDVGDGFYNPVTKCVTDPVSGEVLRIPSTVEEQWIVENSRAAELDIIGYRPDLYQNLFKDTEESDSDEDKMEKSEYSTKMREILNLILQDEGLESRQSNSFGYIRNRSNSLQTKLADHYNLGEIKRMSSIWSRSTAGDFESIIKKIFREKSPSVKSKPYNFYTRLHRGSSLEDYEDFHGDDDLSVSRLLQDIAFLYNRGSRVAPEANTRRSVASTLLESRAESQHNAQDESSSSPPSPNTTIFPSTCTLPMSILSQTGESKTRSEDRAVVSEESSQENSIFRLNINYSDYETDI